ncbi:alcohol dehydrogenase [Aspergillus bombycis]|uniref:Alcohol dehydrogenase n=1 Tax=Aspergillus bombycis TaxID=109264 RepID=A0A1F8A422_9EURO|nr:alcohol dehydrogenase [Aspergillus bombycis]OGM46490.1 alcohol dehydrogenase [Aspergillus bombycis]
MGYDFTVYKGSKDGSIQKSSTHRDELQKDQVLVRVTHSGVCFTDVHYRHADMALGHEGAGVVEATGPEVQDLKKGDRGSFASHAVWRESFLFPIPAGIKNEDAAPLMCGGSTVFNALHVAQVRPTARVGIIGVGGLGHLAIQFAAKMGCQVVVFSGSDSKKDEATKLGATEFYATKGVKELKVEKKLDNLIVTTSSQPDWNQYVSVLNPGAAISPLSVDLEDFKFPYMPLLANGFKVLGSIVSARQVHRDMLDFAAFHGIKPINMTYPMTKEGIEDCLKTLEEGKMRYRGLLIAQ